MRDKQCEPLPALEISNVAVRKWDKVFALEHTTALDRHDDAFQIVETGNFNGSGESGILWRNTSSGDTVLWNPNGSGSFTAEDLGVVGTSFSVHKIFA